MRLCSIIGRFILITCSVFLAVLVSGNSWGHEVVGEVTPLMERMQRVLMLIENNGDEQALITAEKIYDDFQGDVSGKIEAGLKTNGLRVGNTFGAEINIVLKTSIRKRDAGGLQKGLRLLSFLLMLEKFDVLESTFEKMDKNISAQKTIFWLGRNYFSYLLESSIGRTDPVEEKRLDRLLDKMLYRVEDGKWDEFRELRGELEQGIAGFFEFDLPGHPAK